MPDPLRQFIHTSEAWYADTAFEPGVCDEVMISLHDEQDNLIGEVPLRWRDIGDPSSPALLVECFSDSFAAMPMLAPVFQRLARTMGSSEPRMTPKDVRFVLMELGFSDVTERERPKTPGFS